MLLEMLNKILFFFSERQKFSSIFICMTFWLFYENQIGKTVFLFCQFHSY